MPSHDPANIAHRLAELRIEHRDLDQAISRLGSVRAPDELMVTRMKKRKLRVKDMIAHLESLQIPDLDA